MTRSGSLELMLVINGLGTGGAERSLAEMLPGYMAAGIRPTVVCLSRKAEGVADDVERQGFDVQVLRGGGLVGWSRALRRLVARRRPDLIHTTIFESDVAGRLAAAGTSTPVLTSLVNTTYAPIRLQDPNISRTRLQAAKVLDGWTARHLTEHFHAITQAVKAAAVDALRLPPDRITVVERGRDPQRLGRPSAERRGEARARLGLRPDQRVLVTVGRQEFQKGQRHLLDAMALLGEEMDAILLVAGRTGSATEELQRLCSRPSLRDRVRWLGHRDDVPEILAAGDVFVFPSLYEGLGGAIIEAMALGLPVVASRLPAIEEVVEEGRSALLVPVGLPGELADAVSSLLADPARASALGARGRRIFEERFTLKRSTDRMVELYRSVAAAGRRSARTSPRTVPVDP